MAQAYEEIFYETMWRLWGRGATQPYPWWTQAYFRRWSDSFDGGLFDTKQGAFASNASYRYWGMVGLPDQDMESLVGQCGEIEPIYDQYSVSFFLFDPAGRTLHLPQLAGIDGRPSSLTQELEEGYLPAITTTYRSGSISVRQRVLAARLGPEDARSLVLCRLRARLDGAERASVWLCVSISPWGPTGLKRHDRAGRFAADRRLSHLRYVQNEQRVESNAGWGPSFDTAPAFFGVYGNGGDTDVEFYVRNNPYTDLEQRGALNGNDWADDHVAGLCAGVFAWPIDLSSAAPEFALDVRMPIGNYVLQDIRDMAAVPAQRLDDLDPWRRRLSRGAALSLPNRLARYEHQFKLSRIHLVILADGGEIHPGPTIYDSFWVRDSSVEGIACALVGEEDLAETQFGTHYPRVFNRGPGTVGPASLQGFFGGDHEKNDLEWDSNGQALWAFGRFDRAMGRAFQFGNGVFTPYVIDGARWIRDNRSPFGLLPSGWSAEHLGDKDKPHYWDDFWAVAGLWEAGRLAERIGAPASLQSEIWSMYDDVVRATRDSILWSLGEQRARGFWETFIATGPADVGRLDSTIVGAVAYFHPCRLYMGAKLGAEVDNAARMTLETIWGHFVRGGFRHDAAWNCYGPYLTLQLAHAFLYVGQVDRTLQLLDWALNEAGYAHVSRRNGEADRPVQVALGAWNEQHCYPVATNFATIPGGSWYMGDIPHGWACAEYLMLLRDMIFFEADEDGVPHIYLIPGVLPAWLGPGETLRIDGARTFLEGSLSFGVTHDQDRRAIVIDIGDRPFDVHFFVLPCRFGSGVDRIEVDGFPLVVEGAEARIPREARHIVMNYRP